MALQFRSSCFLYSWEFRHIIVLPGASIISVVSQISYLANVFLTPT
jgi:hypothetical protein